MKGVGAEHQMLMSATFICECEHSHLHVSLISAWQGRATPFKKRKSPPLEKEKGKARKPKDLIIFNTNYHELTTNFS